MDLSAFFSEEQPRRAFNELVTGILRDVAPEEVFQFETTTGTPDDLAEAVQSTGGGRTRGLPGTIELGVVCLHLVTGTLAVIESYRQRKERSERQDVERDITQAWQHALIEAGMSPDLARLIPVKFSPDMIRFLMTLRLREKEPEGQTGKGSTRG